MVQYLYMNIFDVLPDSFFNIFIGPNKRIISDCLYIAYKSFRNDLSFSMNKETLLILFTDYFDSHITEIESDEDLKSSRDKAIYILRRLRECGWINEEVGENYDNFVTFEDYSMKVLENLFSLDRDNESEYSGLIYAIYLSFNNFDLNRGDLIFENAFENTKELAYKLKNLNSSIKKYIQKLLDEKTKDDLKVLFDTLLNDYQTKIVDRAYYKLTTYDNPAKYRDTIIDKIKRIMSREKQRTSIVRSIMDRKDISYDEAEELLETQADYIMNSFEHVEEIMNEIDTKNNKFIESAINRIEFILSNKKDIGGKIDSIFKNVNEETKIDDLGNLYINDFSNKDSLYVPRVLKKPLKVKKNEIPILDEKTREMVLDRIQKSNTYSHKYIENYVLNLLKNRNSIKGSELDLDDNDALVKFILIFLYGYSYAAKYEIEPLEEYTKINHYRFKDFIVRKKTDE